MFKILCTSIVIYIPTQFLDQECRFRFECMLHIAFFKVKLKIADTKYMLIITLYCIQMYITYKIQIELSPFDNVKVEMLQIRTLTELQTYKII